MPFLSFFVADKVVLSNGCRHFKIVYFFSFIRLIVPIAKPMGPIKMSFIRVTSTWEVVSVLVLNICSSNYHIDNIKKTKMNTRKVMWYLCWMVTQKYVLCLRRKFEIIVIENNSFILHLFYNISTTIT